MDNTYGFKPNQKKDEEDDQIGGDSMAAPQPAQPVPPPPGNPTYGFLAQTGQPEASGVAPTATFPNGPSVQPPAPEGSRTTAYEYQGWEPNEKTDQPENTGGPQVSGTTFDPYRPAPFSPGTGGGTSYNYQTPGEIEWGFDPSKFDRPDEQTTQVPGSQMAAGGGMNNDLTQYARDWMAAPSRYDANLVQQGMGVIQQRMDELRRQGFQQGEGYLASKGLLGSTGGSELQDMRRAEYDRQEQEQLFNLLREQATTVGQDRALAGNFGLNVGQFGEQQRQFDVDAAQRNRGLDLQRYGLDLNRYQTDMDADYRERRFGFDQQQSDINNRFRQEAMEQDASYRNRALDLQAQGLSADQAYRQSELEWRQKDAANRDRLALLGLTGLDGLTPEMMEAMGFGDMAGLLPNSVAGPPDPAPNNPNDPYPRDWTPPPTTGTGNRPGAGDPYGFDFNEEYY